MIRGLILDRDELSFRASETDIKDLARIECIVTDLTDTLNSLDDTVLYLTSNQIGLDERAFAMRFNDGVRVFINPAIQKKDKMILFRERDYLSKEEYIIPRFTEISLVFQECDDSKLEFGKIKGFKLAEAASIVACQALDALNGLLTSDYGLPVIPEFDEATDEEKSEVLEMYLNELKSSYSELDTDLSNDDETKETWNASKFISGVARGDIETAHVELSNRKKKKLKRFLRKFGFKVKGD